MERADAPAAGRHEISSLDWSMRRLTVSCNLPRGAAKSSRGAVPMLLGEVGDSAMGDRSCDDAASGAAAAVAVATGRARTLTCWTTAEMKGRRVGYSVLWLLWMTQSTCRRESTASSSSSRYSAHIESAGSRNTSGVASSGALPGGCRSDANSPSDLPRRCGLGRRPGDVGGVRPSLPPPATCTCECMRIAPLANSNVAWTAGVAAAAAAAEVDRLGHKAGRRGGSVLTVGPSSGANLAKRSWLRR